MKEEFVVRLNTKENLIAEDGEGGLYTTLGKEDASIYRRGTFDKVIKYCLEQNQDSELQENRGLVTEIRRMLSENSLDTPFEIRVYDENRQFTRKKEDERSVVMHLDDKISGHTHMRSFENGDEYEYLDMLVEQNSKVGI